MARTALTVQAVVDEGLIPAYVAANVDGHQFVNTGKEYLHVKNGGGGGIVVTIQTPATQDGLAVAEQTVSIGAGAEKKIGPFPPRTYNITSGADAGEVYVDFDVITSVTVGCFKLA